MPIENQPTPTCVDAAELRAQKGRLQWGYRQIIAEAAARKLEPLCMDTISQAMNGSEGMHISTYKRIADVLGLRMRVVFEPVPKAD
jgi:hypothetical protein